MELPKTSSKIYPYRETSTAAGEIATTLLMLVLAAATGIWLVLPNLRAALSPGATPTQRLGDMLFYAVLLGLFAWLGIRHGRAAREALDLAANPAQAEGEVVEIWGKEARLNNEFWVAYRYHGGVEGKAEVRKKRAFALQPGDPVRINFLPRDPHVHRVIWDE